ncbi:MAG: hypothetical protein KatS3mg110_1137 [Pirellulaceae bacterium]|nr:MAG: hypothetical protein KatS3mg110_1137 [Pirellulaceae bacterium]
MARAGWPVALGLVSLIGTLHAQQDDIPPHRPLEVPGVHAYPGEHSVYAGQELELHVSSSVPYDLSICRLGPKVDDPAGEELLEQFPPSDPQPVPIYPGSYIHIERSLQGPLEQLSVECWVRLWKVRDRAGMVTQFDHPERCGFGLFAHPDGSVEFYLGDGGEHRATGGHRAGAIADGKWHHVVGTWDGQEKCLWIDGRQAGRWPYAGPVNTGEAELRIGAAGEQGRAAAFLDADLAMPALYQHALTGEQVHARYEAKALALPPKEGLLACWPLDEERGDRVRDVSAAGRSGRIINHGTWMIGGPSFNAAVPRFGEYLPEKDPARGHGLRLASDDLYDCRWPIRHRWLVPEEARPGFYVARFRYTYEQKERTQYVTFIVKRPADRPASPILVLAATNTWRAYSGTPFAIPPAERKQVWGTGGIQNGPTSPPAYNLYRAHAAGQGTYQVGLRMPWPAAGPHILYGGPTDYSHLMRAERFLHAWLEEQGYLFDVISDVDLHRQPEILHAYKVLIICGHNEYWSIPMYQALESYLRSGGNVINLSGNTIFWRVSFDPECRIMECRKVDAPGNQLPPERRGEAWHSQDGRRGGLMRECGYPGWRLLGLETLGWNNQSNPENFGPFVVQLPDHPLFRHPEPLGLLAGQRIGQRPEGGVPMANGHEFDVRISTLRALAEAPPPAGAQMPEEPPGIVQLANGVIPWSKGGSAFDYFLRPIRPKNDQGGEMIYWERPEGGRVFNAGTIGFSWAMAVDPKLQGLMRNVLAHFGVARPEPSR